MKKKILFALLMGIVSTGIISFTLVTVNSDLNGSQFYKVWFRSWLIAYVIAIPCILLISPLVEQLVNKIIKQ